MVLATDAPPTGLIDTMYLTGALGLGGALVMVHMYAAEIKSAILALYAVGAVGSLGAKLALAGDAPLALWVAAHPWGVWLVGPMFAALTGLAIKEGLCYGKAEAAVIAALLPVGLLGHLTGALGEGAERGVATLLLLAMATFGARKWTQPVEADLGDKSIFDFMALSEAEQQAQLERLGMAQPEE